ncbi:MAG TPA: large conductance mechanosensitive channel protein MscL [Puia sp.]|jgi:large conductance mechanosensitive channel|nr:large conductance mechanosensitive channel protein MscL [Puia sp.]
MAFLKEFRDFVMRGSVIDLAVAVIVGAAFTAIVTSLTDNVITPLLLAPALKAAHLSDIDKLAWGAVKYGLFLSAVLKFIIFALILFLFIKGIHSLHKKKAAAPAEPSSTDKLLMEIRDELKKGKAA